MLKANELCFIEIAVSKISLNSQTANAYFAANELFSFGTYKSVRHTNLSKTLASLR